MNVQIQRYTKIEGAGSLLGMAQVLFVDVGLTINGVKIIESKTGGKFYAFPSEKYQDKDTGEEKYREHAAFYIKGRYQQFNDAMNAAFKVYFQQNPPQQNAIPQETRTPPAQPIPMDDFPF